MADKFISKKFNKAKLLGFGFIEEDGTFVYNQLLMDNQFKLSVLIDSSGNIRTKLFDLATDELYTLHLVEGVNGTFVGKIKEEYNNILERISAECFEPDVFKAEQTKELILYIKEKYNDDPEYLWEKFPDNAIVRRKDNAKWYAGFLTVSKQKFGFKETASVEVIDLRAENVDELIDFTTVFPGYHMNKKHWITIILDGSVSLNAIKSKIDESYMIAKKR